MNLFIDANILVKAFFENKDREKCRRILSEGFITDTLCLAEARDALSRILKNKELATRWMKSVFKTNGIVMDVDKNILFESFKYVERLKILDAIHYATAVLNDCQEFLSYDKDFDGLEIKRAEP